MSDEHPNGGPRPQAPISTHGGPGHGPLAWRILVVLAVIASCAALALVAIAFTKNQQAIQANHELGCRIGTFFVGTPITQEPGESDQAFRHGVLKAIGFVSALKKYDCPNVGHARITQEQLARTLQRLRHALPPPQHLHSHRSATAPSSAHASTGAPGSVTTSAQQTPSSPGASSPGPGSTTTVSAPPGTTTQRPPPTTTTTTTTTQPPPTTTSLLDPIVRTICHLNPLGIRICVTGPSAR